MDELEVFLRSPRHWADNVRVVIRPYISIGRQEDMLWRAYGYFQISSDSFPEKLVVGYKAVSEEELLVEQESSYLEMMARDQLWELFFSIGVVDINWTIEPVVTVSWNSWN